MKSKTMFEKFFYLTALIFVLFLLPAVSHAAPKLFFSDLDSGPKTGWEGSTTKGAAVTVWGKGFGSTRGSNYITVNGAQLTSASDYAEWGVTGTANGIPRGLERVTFWIPSSATDGVGQITITVNGEASNALSFTVRAGNIYFVAPNGNDSNNGRTTSAPRQSLQTFTSLSPGDILYAKGGEYISQNYRSNDAHVMLYDFDGTPGNPIALVAYPGEVPWIDSSKQGGGTLVRQSDWSGTTSDYLVFSKFKAENSNPTNGGFTIFQIIGSHIRIIGNTMLNLRTYSAAGIFNTDNTEYLYLYGNYVKDSGTDNWAHFVYGKTKSAIPGGETAYQYIAYNEVDGYVDNLGPHACGGGMIDIARESDAGAKTSHHIYIHSNLFKNSGGGLFYTEGGTNDAYAVNNIYVYNNLIINGTPCTIYPDQFTFHGFIQDFYVFNNTIYKSGLSNLSFIAVWGQNALMPWPQFKNNIFITIDNTQPYFYLDGIAEVYSDYDLYYSSPIPSGSRYYITNTRTGDPLFVNPSAGDFTLQSASPAIDTGSSSVASVVTKDYDGNTRPMGAGYDIGAYEYAGPAVPMLQFSSATYSVSEGAGTATISVTRIGSSVGAVSVNYATNNGTATSGSDYTTASGTLNWANGETTSQTFTVSIINDTLVEGDETINLTLSSPTNGAILGSQSAATLTILDDDGPSTLRFESSSYSVSEGAGTATISVTRTGSSAGAVSVSYATSNGTATAGSDYTAASGTLNWADGDAASKTFTITIINDTVVESNETVNITLSNPTNTNTNVGAALGSPNSVALTITDNDSNTTTLGKNTGSNEISGGGCGFVKDDNGNGPRANGGAATFAMMLILTLFGIALARRFQAKRKVVLG